MSRARTPGGSHYKIASLRSVKLISTFPSNVSDSLCSADDGKTEINHSIVVPKILGERLNGMTELSLNARKFCIMRLLSGVDF